MRSVLTRNEAILLAAFAALCALAWFGPPLAQPPHAHDFADQRVLWGIPHAFDVLSNLPFALAGCWGLVALTRASDCPELHAQQACAGLFFIGLLFTAVGSSIYHFAPGDLGLALDRGAMGLAFAGLLGMAAARVSDRAGTLLAAGLLVLAPASVAVWVESGNVLPWAVVQFGGIALLLLAMALGSARAAALPVRWSLVLLAYALAKLLEANDHAILDATGQCLSGHTLKHVVAALAAWPVIAALASAGQRQNARTTAALAA